MCHVHRAYSSERMTIHGGRNTTQDTTLTDTTPRLSICRALISFPSCLGDGNQARRALSADSVDTSLYGDSSVQSGHTSGGTSSRWKDMVDRCRR
jgi:hypothetical protein